MSAFIYIEQPYKHLKITEKFERPAQGGDGGGLTSWLHQFTSARINKSINYSFVTYPDVVKYRSTGVIIKRITLHVLGMVL